MKKMTVFFSVLITLCIALTLVYSPNYILTNSNRNVLHEWQRKGFESYAGIINVWHVIGFKAHRGSTSFWLNSRAVEFEREYNNVYINIIPMNVEEYQTMLASGEKPDVLSYPLGLEYSDSFLPYDDAFTNNIESEMNPYLKSVGMVENSTFALPYLYSGYALMLNTEKVNRAQILFEEEITKEKLQEASEKLFVEAKGKKKTVYGVSGNHEVAAILGLRCQLGDYESFLYNNAGMALADFRAVGDMERLNTNGKGIICEAKPITSYTNQVQLISISKEINIEKIGFAYDFVRLLYSEEAQSELFSMNLYTATKMTYNEENPLTGIAFDSYEMYKKPKVPNAFMYKRYSDSLKEEALRAISGDKEGNLAFFGRINEMLMPSMRYKQIP